MSIDCISRQAVIDAHYEYCNKHPDAGFPVWSLKIFQEYWNDTLVRYTIEKEPMAVCEGEQE